jgi:outer membrane protein assembly factor BamB
VNPDGTLKWKSPIAAALPSQQSAPAIGADGTVYFAAENNHNTAGNLYAVSPADGSVRWSFPTGGGGNISSPVIGDDGSIYFGSGDNNLYAVNPDGTLKWKFSANWSVSSSLALGGDGTVYFGSGSPDSHLYAVTDGGQNTVTLKWMSPTGPIVQSSPAVAADGTIYVGSIDRNLYAVHPMRRKEPFGKDCSQSKACP